MGEGLTGVSLCGRGASARRADALRRFLLLVIDSRMTLSLGPDWELSWQKVGLSCDRKLRVKSFHALMRGGKTVFNLPEAEQRKGGDFVERMEWLAQRNGRDKARWACYSVMHSYEFCKMAHETPLSRVDVAWKLHEEGKDTFNKNFRYHNVQEGHRRNEAFDKGGWVGYCGKVMLRGRTKREVGEDMIKSIAGIDRFGVSHALILLCRGSASSLNRHGVTEVQNSVFLGCGCDDLLLLLGSGRMGFEMTKLQTGDLEKLLFEERKAFRKVARQMLKKKELTTMPYQLRKACDVGGSSSSWLALPETFADVLCEGRQAINVLLGMRKLKDRRDRMYRGVCVCTVHCRVLPFVWGAVFPRGDLLKGIRQSFGTRSGLRQVSERFL